MEIFINTAGPNILEDNYTKDPLSRFDVEDVLTLIRQKRYVFYSFRRSNS